MRNKRIISLVLITALVFSFFPASVYADTVEDSLKSIMTSIGNIVKEIIKIFKDIKESDWFAENVSLLYELGIINGKPQKDGTVIFDPKGLVTKGEFTKMLVTAMDYEIVDGNSFQDLRYEVHWAKKYIETAVKEGVIDPETEGDKFWPDIPIKRNDMAYMMFKALKLEASENKSPFPDVDCGCITKLHEEYLINGIPQGDKTYFAPSGLTTRAEAAAIIARMVEYKENPESYKEKKIAEVKANEFVEPEFEVRHTNDGRRLMEVFITNYAEYDEYYSFNFKCINYPQINYTWDTGLYGPPEIAEYSKMWLTPDDLAYLKGRAAFILSWPYYADKTMKKSFQAKPGMVFEIKITIKKGEKTKEYNVPVEIPSE